MAGDSFVCGSSSWQRCSLLPFISQPPAAWKLRQHSGVLPFLESFANQALTCSSAEDLPGTIQPWYKSIT